VALSLAADDVVTALVDALFCSNCDICLDVVDSGVSYTLKQRGNKSPSSCCHG
jgi:hypothetical protein